MCHTVVEASVIEPLFREALPRATEEEIAELVALCAGRTLDDDNADLLHAFRLRDRPISKIHRVEILVGCLLCGRRNAWSCGEVRRSITGLVKRAAARAV